LPDGAPLTCRFGYTDLRLHLTFEPSISRPHGSIAAPEPAIAPLR
jgi:hypothetical protein